jgi:hypothetical protein
MALRMTYCEDPIRKNGAVITRQVQQKTIEFDSVLDFMRVGTAFSVSDMRSVFAHFVEFLVRYLPEGNKVQTPLGAFYLSLRQSYASEGAAAGNGSSGRRISLDYLTIRVRPDKDVLSRLRSAVKVEVVTAPALVCPGVLSLENLEKPDTPLAGSPGDVLHLCGANLSFLKEDADAGVFFIKSVDKTESRAGTYIRIGSNILNVKLPVLPPGEYSVEVRSRPTKKDLRSGAFPSAFTVL